ncbi:TLP18.3, Psb32 and MOLO-1 founding protein of phosphatase [Tangfeifania diversioriginum]|uniref:TLP18.3, Psb32 and MOLO-1 founding protein of phosphatase n=1 Tax=Tangfeifania diversioriginum TaxID=1168035 RepID=A0A1M6P6I1_9BACT|nr:TPM domain-containing protein [Tangfeifania diversioriginum]SHK03544.1 TLP18.3, Psb32 and MOLO-1 founding protein of phosphatase [Tangfeifania diversioriginum]
MSVRKYFSEKDKLQIKNAIRAAELNTSGEVRVHIEKHCREDVLDRAAFWFQKLEMHKTELRNGVLFYLAVDDRKFAILGDAGINQKVPDDFWEEIKEKMAEKFKEGLFAEGLSQGIRMTGEQLKAHFPYQEDDVNELSDEISYG